MRLAIHALDGDGRRHPIGESRRPRVSRLLGDARGEREVVRHMSRRHRAPIALWVQWPKAPRVVRRIRPVPSDDNPKCSPREIGADISRGDSERGHCDRPSSQDGGHGGRRDERGHDVLRASKRIDVSCDPIERPRLVPHGKAVQRSIECQRNTSERRRTDPPSCAVGHRILRLSRPRRRTEGDGEERRDGETSHRSRVHRSSVPHSDPVVLNCGGNVAPPA